MEAARCDHGNDLRYRLPLSDDSRFRNSLRPDKLISDKIDPKALGGITGLWRGTGVVGLAFILYFVLRLQLRPRK